MDEEENDIEEKKKKIPIIVTRTVQKIGDSLHITLPTEWTREKRITKGDRLLVIANGSIKIITPRDASEIYNNVSDFVKKPVDIEEEQKEG